MSRATTSLQDGPGQHRSAAAGEVLLREADPGDSVLLLLDGHVKVTVATGRQPTAVLDFCGPGEMLGEIGAVTGRRSATVTAIGPVRCWSVPREDFHHRLAADRSFAIEVERRLAERLLAAERRATSSLGADASARVAGRLVDLAERFGVDAAGGRRIALPFSQDELAGLSGCSLESVARALRTLRAAGWLHTGRLEMTVRDLDALRARAAV